MRLDEIVWDRRNGHLCAATNLVFANVVDSGLWVLAKTPESGESEYIVWRPNYDPQATHCDALTAQALIYHLIETKQIVVLPREVSP